MISIGFSFEMRPHAVTTFCVSGARSFTSAPSTVCDYEYGAFSVLTHFTYCFLQKIMTANSLPVFEQWGKHASEAFAVNPN